MKGKFDATVPTQILNNTVFLKSKNPCNAGTLCSTVRLLLKLETKEQEPVISDTRSSA